MRERSGPLPQPFWRKRLAVNVLPPLMGTHSGELASNVQDITLGATRFAGEITGVWMSVSGSGKDDSNELNITGEIYINETTALSTTCKIAHISGEAAQHKTTKITGDTGITEAVVNKSQNSFSPGDVITGKFTVQRTGSPTTEIKNPCIVVELEPVL